MAALKTVSLWLEGSGWRNAIVKAEVATSGTADSCIQVELGWSNAIIEAKRL